MLYPQILLGLAATASAIDAYFHLGQNCDGPAIVCTNLNPDVCCTASSSNTVGYRGIPTNWAITAQAFSGGGCTYGAAAESARNTNFVCIHLKPGGSIFTGTRYHFDSKRKTRAGVEGRECPATEQAGTQPCTQSRKADQLLFEDGVQFDLSEVDDDVYTEL